MAALAAAGPGRARDPGRLDGRPGAALLRLGLLAAVIVVLGWLWVRSLGRALVTADTTTQSSAVRGAGCRSPGLGLRGTVAARFRIYQRREPAVARLLGASSRSIMAAVSASSVIRPPASSRGVILGSAVFGAAFVGDLPRQLDRR